MKLMIVSVACTLCSVALFPLFAIGGTIALFLIAAGAESLHSITGASVKRIDHAATRSMAMRI